MQEDEDRVYQNRTPRGTMMPPRTGRGNGHIPYASTVRSSDDMMKAGLDLVGFKGRQEFVTKAHNIARFRAFFGVGHQAVYELYKDLMLIPDELKFFFMTLYWLKSYDTELILSGWWDLHIDTIRRRTWSICKKIQGLKATKVSPRKDEPSVPSTL